MLFQRSAQRYAALVPAAMHPADAFDLFSDPNTGQKNPTHQVGAKLFTIIKGAYIYISNLSWILTLDPSLTLDPLSGHMQDLGQVEGFDRMLSSRGVTVGPIFTEGVGKDSPLDGSDVLVANDRGLNTLFLHNQDSHVSMEPHDLSDPYQNSRALAIADFDADGLTDIILAAWDGTTQVSHQYM